ncbi:hypothetical protein LZ30DRAFT_95515 [Colletotrichum cereale]|nr:hypothetical protein LZ30DRAFT_95515 [Colletotrichum cereale]
MSLEETSLELPGYRWMPLIVLDDKCLIGTYYGVSHHLCYISLPTLCYACLFPNENKTLANGLSHRIFSSILATRLLSAPRTLVVYLHTTNGNTANKCRARFWSKSQPPQALSSHLHTTTYAYLPHLDRYLGTRVCSSVQPKHATRYRYTKRYFLSGPSSPRSTSVSTTPQ